MSSPLAIAGISHVLKGILTSAFGAGISGLGSAPSFTLQPPDRADPATDQSPAPRVNLYLYQVTPNNAWRNAALPAMSSEGDRTASPPLVLNLRYMLTVYGIGDLQSEILLGVAALALHESPLLTRGLLRDRLEQSPIPEAADVAEQVEHIRVSMMTNEMEELNRIWSALQSPYRTSLLFEVTAVMIDSKKLVRAALPVSSFSITALPMLSPVITRLLSQPTPASNAVEGRPVAVGERLVFEGKGLRSPGVRVRFSDGSTVVPTGSTSSRLEVVVPPSLRAGVQGARVVHPTMLGDPPVEHAGEESNLAAFVLRPRIDAITGRGPAGALAVTTDPATGRKSASVTVSVVPAVAWTQRAELFLNELHAPANRPARGYSFKAHGPPPTPAPRTETRSVLTFDIRDVEPGRYLARVHVDDASSLPDRAGGELSGPIVDLT